MKYIYISFITLIIFNTKLKAQDIKNVDFTFQNNNFTITYDIIDCRYNFMYDVKLTMEGRESGVYTPINVSGDLNNLTCGNGKKITWSPLAEGKQIKEDVRFIITINKQYKVEEKTSNLTQTSPSKFTSGPGNAIKSLFIPGLGGISVQKTKLPLLLTAGFIFSGIQAFRYNTITNTNYSNYLTATTQTEMNRLFDNAVSARNTTNMYVGIAAGLWATDIIFTLIKGSINKQNYLYGKQKTSNLWKLNVSTDYYSFNIGLKKQIK